MFACRGILEGYGEGRGTHPDRLANLAGLWRELLYSPLNDGAIPFGAFLLLEASQINDDGISERRSDLLPQFLGRLDLQKHLGLVRVPHATLQPTLREEVFLLSACLRTDTTAE